MSQSLNEMSLADLAFEYRQAGRFPFSKEQQALSSKIVEELRRRDERMADFNNAGRAGAGILIDTTQLNEY